MGHRADRATLTRAQIPAGGGWVAVPILLEAASSMWLHYSEFLSYNEPHARCTMVEAGSGRGALMGIPGGENHAVLHASPASDEPIIDSYIVPGDRFHVNITLDWREEPGVRWMLLGVQEQEPGWTDDVTFTIGADRPFLIGAPITGAIHCVSTLMHFPEGDVARASNAVAARDVIDRFEVDQTGIAWLSVATEGHGEYELRRGSEVVQGGTTGMLGEDRTPNPPPLDAGEYTFSIPTLSGPMAEQQWL